MLKAFVIATLAAAVFGFPLGDPTTPPGQAAPVTTDGQVITGKTDSSQTLNQANKIPPGKTRPPTGSGRTALTPPTTPVSEAWRQACKNVGGYTCPAAPTATPKKKTSKAPTATQLRQVVAKLHLPDTTPRLGPDPSVNEWNMLAVGYPIWLWTDQPNQLTTTTTHDGLTFTLTATKTNTTFTLGDSHTKTCPTTTPYPSHTNQPSPTCSYTYQDPSPIGHPYTITATNTWHITWTTNGNHGTLTHTTTATRTLDVGELQSMIIG